MSKKINVLITAPSGGSVGEQVFEALKMSKLTYYIVTTNVEPNKNGLYEADKGYIVPLATDRSYISRLLWICKKEKIRVIIPGSSPELDVIAKNRAKFEEKNILVLTNDLKVVELCQDKLRTMEFLKNQGLSYPKFEILKKAVLPLGFHFPVVIKPTKGGGGSRNVFLLQDNEDLKYYYRFYQKQGLIPLIQEYIGDATEEYTVGVLTDFEGKLLGSIVLKREVKGDLSVRTEVKSYKDPKKSLVLSSGFSQGFVDDYPKIKDYAEKVALALGSRGPLNVQCRKTKEAVYTMEINPRFSGTAAIRALLGFNEPDTLIRRHLLGEKIGKLSYKKGLVLRDLRMVYVSFDKIKKIEKRKFIKN